MKKKDLGWLIGIICGDGYIGYGRVALDTTSHRIAERTINILRKLTNSEIKLEVYGDCANFEKILSENFLHYGKKSNNSSTTLKIRIDSVKFSKEILKLKKIYLKNILNRQLNEKIGFLQGVFDSEGTISPDCTIQIDMSKRNLNLLKICSAILNELQIKHTLKEYKSKIRLKILGGTKNLFNVEKFCYTIGFSSEKQNELEEIIKIYKLPRETRSKSEVKKLILNLLRENKEIELKKLMFMLNVKYDFIKELLNELSEKSVVKKFRKGKRVFIKSPDPGPIGK
jgi:predicted transcriptional regulator